MFCAWLFLGASWRFLCRLCIFSTRFFFCCHVLFATCVSCMVPVASRDILDRPPCMARGPCATARHCASPRGLDRSYCRAPCIFCLGLCDLPQSENIAWLRAPVQCLLALKTSVREHLPGCMPPYGVSWRRSRCYEEKRLNQVLQRLIGDEIQMCDCAPTARRFITLLSCVYGCVCVCFRQYAALFRIMPPLQF